MEKFFFLETLCWWIDLLWINNEVWLFGSLTLLSPVFSAAIVIVLLPLTALFPGYTAAAATATANVVPDMYPSSHI